MSSQGLQVQEEILLAKQSRREGNEGRARVCARRAAGAAVQGYLKDQGEPQESAIQSLAKLKQLVTLPDRVGEAVGWLLRHVDEEFNLPPEVDLIQEALIVINYIEVGTLRGISPDS